MKKEVFMKKISVWIEILIAFLLIAISILLNLATDPVGRDLVVDLRGGYMIESANSEEQALVRWTKEREEKDPLNHEAVILAGTFGKFYADHDYIMIFDEKNKTYYCINKENEKIIYESQDENKAKVFLEKTFGKKDMKWEEL